MFIVLFENYQWFYVIKYSNGRGLETSSLRRHFCWERSVLVAVGIICVISLLHRGHFLSFYTVLFDV